jgi:hypothetical protein
VLLNKAFSLIHSIKSKEDMNTKINTKLILAVVAAFISFFGLASAAKAGEGGAAGAAAFSLSNNQVTGAAVSAAVGKQNAAATATNRAGHTRTTITNGVTTTTLSPAVNTASAVGSAGTVSIGTNGAIKSTTETGTLGTAQNNQFNRAPQIPVTTGIGTVTIKSGN